MFDFGITRVRPAHVYVGKPSTPIYFGYMVTIMHPTSLGFDYSTRIYLERDGERHVLVEATADLAVREEK